jgi:long-chain acyl-CoA synthetase
MVNLFQRMVNLVAMTRNVPYHYVENPREIMKWLSRLKPTLFVGVPRFFEKCYQGLMLSLPRPAAALFEKILRFTQKIVRCQRLGKTLSLSERGLFFVLNALLLHPVRRIWGGQLRVTVSGSAPCSPSGPQLF